MTISRLLLLVPFLLLIGCAKDGETGPSGKNGINGTNGTNGNTNVHTSIIQVPTSSWTIVSSSELSASILDTNITQSIVDSGTVLLYIKISDSWYTLPYAQTITSTTTYDWAFGYKTDTLIIRTFNRNGIYSTFPSPKIFKVTSIGS